eukprot:2308558-Prymnesium_polylepis.1
MDYSQLSDSWNGGRETWWPRQGVGYHHHPPRPWAWAAMHGRPWRPPHCDFAMSPLLGDVEL